ncbi:MAG TPA: hypothetical protein PKN47_09035 [Nitrospira sp.]|nr:hypothetical protein [Nitrospira sp.]
MAKDEDAPLLTLRKLLDDIQLATKRESRSKASISHELAQGFMTVLRGVGATILEVGKGNANYFVFEFEGKTIAVSPFSSHEEWWEKPSEGFRCMTRNRGCDWGVVLFFVQDHEGVWIEGPEFDRTVLKGREKVNSNAVQEARRKKLARPFYRADEFLRLVRTPASIPPRPFLVRRTPGPSS